MPTGSGHRERLSVLFAGGGTGGHLYPAVAIADEIRRRRPDAEIVFVGTRGKIEARVVPASGYRFVSIVVSGFRRSFSLATLVFPVKLGIALVQSFILIRKMRPCVVVGTGGYVCGPPLYAAARLRIPTLIQEQNSYPGVTTRLLARVVSEVHLTFESSRRFLKRTDNVWVTGNPTRVMIGHVGREEAAKMFGLDPGRQTLLVFGGSLGARSINTAMLAVIREVTQMGVQVIWQTGESDGGQAAARVKELGCGAMVRVHTFIERMEFAYAAADLAICRAGATTLAELTSAGLPSVLVPYPFAAADHQTENARAMVDAGAALMVRDLEIQEKLLKTLRELLERPDQLKEMSQQALSLGKPGATDALASAVLRLAGKNS